MIIALWDLEYFNKVTKEGNVDCMYLSSFYKQKGYTVNFITEIFHTKNDFDQMIIFKEYESTPLPKGNFINNNKVKLCGDGFKYHKTIKLQKQIFMCRPDYLLYNLKSQNSYIKFFWNDELIEDRQEFMKKHIKNQKDILLVKDKNFWKQKKEDIEYCLNILKDYQNIYFEDKISISLLYSDINIMQKVLNLKLKQKTYSHIINDIEPTYDNAFKIFEYFKQFDKKDINKLGTIEFYSLTTNHYAAYDNFIYDWERCLKIIDLWKSENMKCVIIPPKELETPYYWVFKGMNFFTTNMYDLSYIESLTYEVCMEDNIPWYIVVNEKSKWKSKKILFLLNMLWEHKNIMKNFATRKLKKEKIEWEEIDWESIKNHLYQFEKEK